ncbi:MAG: hypothetical protein Q9N34_09000 [Aquificota bacterium]|nr:hypothetical protein [Aquificota bacterium]
MKKLIQKLFIIYLVAGGALLVMDAIDKKLNPPPFHISFSEPEYESFTLNEKQMERVKEEIEKFVSVGRAKWFLPPSYGNCVFRISRSREGILYELCKNKKEKGKWWIIREGSYKRKKHQVTSTS